jgi:hypothetical protein
LADGRTDTITASTRSSNPTSSTTVHTKPNALRHTLLFRTPICLLELDR